MLELPQLAVLEGSFNTMGRGSGCSRSTANDYEDNGNEHSNGGKYSLYHYLDNLFEKRGSTREIALSSIIEGLSISCRHQFAEKKFATILYRCLNSFKKGSIKERHLASDALGLLAITVGCGDNAHELYAQTLPILSEALKSGSESGNLISILDCLAIVTFVGRSDLEETQKSMQNIWHYIHSESGYNVGRGNHSAAVRRAAISAWSFLLSTMDGWTLKYKYWQGAIPFFLNLLEADDESVHVAAGEALALIFEVGCLEKFSGNSKNGTDSSPNDETNLLNGASSVQELKEQVLNRMSFLSLKEKAESLVDKSVKKHSSTWDFIKVLEDDGFPNTSVKIGKQTLKLKRWSQLLQLNFMKRLLGGGFVRHMLENELLHDVFDFTPGTRPAGKALYVCEREEVKVRLFVPEVKKNNGEDFPQIHKSPSPAFRKARTQLLNKKRDIKGKELWSSYC